MKILFDHQCFAVNKYNGISRYFSELLPLLVKYGVELDLPFTFTQSVCLLPLHLKNFVTMPDFVDDRVARRINKYAGLAQSARELRRGSYDIVHPTQYNPYFFKYTGRPVVVTIHDMVHEIFQGTEFALPNFDKEINDKRECILKSDIIIAVSENTKRDILYLYPEIAPEKVHVIHHGYTSAGLSTAPNPYGKYILYVGKRWGYKNFTNFLRAVSPLLREDKELFLLCTGQDFTLPELQLLSDLKISGQCHALFLSESELETAYRHALVFVYPSLYEGFGLPILEAFSQDCPVCLSDTSSFPEIAGDAALYFDPTNVTSMRTAVSDLIHNDGLRNALVEKGRARLTHFSWENSAQEHLRVYQSLI